MKLQYTSKYMVVRNNYLYLNDHYTHMRWVKWNIGGLLSKGEKKKLSRGIINKAIHLKLWGLALASAKHEHP